MFRNWNVDLTKMTPDEQFEYMADSAREQRRYEIAKAVLAGFAALDHETWQTSFISTANATKSAVEWADALLAELEKQS